MSDLRNAACAYALSGWAVHPLRPRSKLPASEHGMNDATSDPGQVLRWWTERPDCNIGVNCEASGLVVIDVDPRHGGDDTLAELEVELGPLPDTKRALTGGGGLHIFLRDPRRIIFRGSLGPGVDLKSCGYVVLPPSQHPNGRRYEWEV